MGKAKAYLLKVQAFVNLIKIKSLITILLTLTFCAAVFIQMFTSIEIPQPLVTVYIAVISFYFGTQTGKHIKRTEDDILISEEDKNVDY